MNDKSEALTYTELIVIKTQTHFFIGFFVVVIALLQPSDPWFEA